MTIFPEAGLNFPDLVYAELKASKSEELSRRRRALNITGLREDHSAENVANTGDRKDWRIYLGPTEKPFY